MMLTVLILRRVLTIDLSALKRTKMYKSFSDTRPTVWNKPSSNWLPTRETTAKGSPRGAQSREMGPSLGGPGEKSEKPRRKPVAVRDE